jgi:hypothetical protein
MWKGRRKEGDDAWDSCISLCGDRGRVDGVVDILRVENGESVGMKNSLWR